MATMAFQPILSKQRVTGGQLVFRKQGTQKYVNLGALASMEFTPNLTEIESYTQEFGDRRLIKKYVTTKDGQISFVCESWSELGYEILFMANRRLLTQTAVTSGTLTIDDVAVGDAVKIPGFKPTVTAVSDGADNDLVEDVHYTVHRAGYLQIIALPAGFTGDAVIEYTLPAITESEGLLDLDLMSTAGVRGELVFIGVTSESGDGEEFEQTYHDVELRPSGAVPAFGTEQLNQFTVQGSVYATSNKNSYGTIRSIPKA